MKKIIALILVSVFFFQQDIHAQNDIGKTNDAGRIAICPVIGNIPDFENIFINTGHFRKGILQAPASAQLLADYLFKNTSFMDIDRFSLGTIEKI